MIGTRLKRTARKLSNGPEALMQIRLLRLSTEGHKNIKTSEAIKNLTRARPKNLEDAERERALLAAAARMTMRKHPLLPRHLRLQTS